MKRATPAPSPEAYLGALRGWRRECVAVLRSTVRASASLEERIKWGHLVHLSNGPVLLIRAEESRVLPGFRRGRRLRAVEPRLQPGGKYEMATLELRKGMGLEPAAIRSLTRQAVALNRALGDWTLTPHPVPRRARETR
jgi:hypothetical protein